MAGYLPQLGQLGHIAMSDGPAQKGNVYRRLAQHYQRLYGQPYAPKVQGAGGGGNHPPGFIGPPIKPPGGQPGSTNNPPWGGTAQNQAQWTQPQEPAKPAVKPYVPFPEWMPPGLWNDWHNAPYWAQNLVAGLGPTQFNALMTQYNTTGQLPPAFQQYVQQYKAWHEQQAGGQPTAPAQPAGGTAPTQPVGGGGGGGVTELPYSPAGQGGVGEVGSRQWYLDWMNKIQDRTGRQIPPGALSYLPPWNTQQILQNMPKGGW